MALEPSELILNEDGSIYHLNLKPEDIASTIITVGDPERVNLVTSFFDSIDFETQNREFHTQTGTYQDKKITVISTGIGTDNIDIVFNELDALANIDLANREVKENFSQLDFIRIGTSGTIQPTIDLDSFLLSETAIGFDSLLHYYESEFIQNKEIAAALEEDLNFSKKMPTPYVVDCNPTLKSSFLETNQFIGGVTATNIGFYGPQGRTLRATQSDKNLIEKLTEFEYQGIQITNLEMETSGIYGMAALLGHRAISLNAIIANRTTGEFSSNPHQTIEDLIDTTLNTLVSI